MRPVLQIVKERGVTLIEMAVGLVIIAIAMAMAIPAFSRMLQDSQIRNAAESILSGIQLARGQAVASNSKVCIQFYSQGATAPSSTGTSWAVAVPTTGTSASGITTISTVDCTTVPAGNANIIQQRNGAEGTPNVTVSAATNGGTAVAYISFGGLGSYIDPKFTPPGTIINIDVQNSKGACYSTTATSGLRCMRIQVNQAGEVRMCDPYLVAGGTSPNAQAGDPRLCL